MLAHKADAHAEEGNCRGIERMQLISGFGLSLMLALVSLLLFIRK